MADVYCFPENALYMRLQKDEKIPAISLESDVFEPFVEKARELKAYFYFGSVPLLLNGKVFNSTVVIDPEGNRTAPYQKIHLFDIDIEGQTPFRESRDFAHGSQTRIENWNGFLWGLSVCYDLRFPELYLNYAKKNVDVIAVPSAFLVKTGQAHWHTLLRARAIESQCYVVAAAQSGSHKGLRETYGHSLVINPWGEVVVELSEKKPAVLLVELDKSVIQNVRNQIPMSSHRRI